MGGKPQHQRVRLFYPITRERKIHAGLARKAWQGIGCPHIGEEPNADLRHREEIALARNPMGAMQGHADSTTHDDAIDEGNVRLGIALDEDVELVLLSPERECLIACARLQELSQPPDVSSGAEGLLARALDDDPGNGWIVYPSLKGLAHAAHHGEGQGIEGARAVEGDDASRTQPFANDFRVLVHERSPSFRPQACLRIKQGTRLPSMHGCLEPLFPP